MKGQDKTRISSVLQNMAWHFGSGSVPELKKKKEYCGVYIEYMISWLPS